MERLNGMEVSGDNGGALLGDQGHWLAWRDRRAFAVGWSHGQVGWLVGIGFAIRGDMYGPLSAGGRLEAGARVILDGADGNFFRLHVLFPNGRIRDLELWGFLEIKRRTMKF